MNDLRDTDGPRITDVELDYLITLTWTQASPSVVGGITRTRTTTGELKVVEDVERVDLYGQIIADAMSRLGIHARALLGDVVIDAIDFGPKYLRRA